MNIFFLLSGLLLFLVSAAHAWWGEKNLFPAFFKESLPDGMKVSLYVPWHQSTFMLFTFGLFMIMASLQNSFFMVSYLVLTVITGNLIIFTLTCIVKKEQKVLADSVVQYVLFFLLILFIVLGISFD
ncbi:MAG: hypothetical protein KKH98_11680 [Spirochaetes bacterium]|nr:hypothetical protein [Spirochaetota bacterium]